MNLTQRDEKFAQMDEATKVYICIYIYNIYILTHIQNTYIKTNVCCPTYMHTHIDIYKNIPTFMQTQIWKALRYIYLSIQTHINIYIYTCMLYLIYFTYYTSIFVNIPSIHMQILVYIIQIRHYIGKKVAKERLKYYPIFIVNKM